MSASSLHLLILWYRHLQNRNHNLCFERKNNYFLLAWDLCADSLPHGTGHPQCISWNFLCGDAPQWLECRGSSVQSLPVDEY